MRTTLLVRILQFLLRFSMRSCMKGWTIAVCVAPINMDTDTRQAKRVAAGILLSINETHPRDEVIAPLRLNAHRGDWDIRPRQFARLGIAGADI